MKRCFVTVGGSRQVHYRRHGTGPPLVLIHESPQTSSAYLGLMEQLGDRFTTIALDRPGYGLSDPLTNPAPEIADYADAAAEAIVALGLGAVPVYGHHTGALVVLELARRAPGSVSLAIADALPHFDEEQAAELAERYAPPIVPAFDGSHLLHFWARERNSSLYFPWYRQDPAHRRAVPGPAVADSQRRLLDILRVGSRYALSYRAAFRYRPLEALAAPDPSPRAPLAFICRTDDLQAGGQSLLPAEAGAELLPPERWLDRLAELAEGASTLVAAPPEPAAEHLSGRLSRGFVDTPAGQLLVRRAGLDVAAARPVVLLHGMPGGAQPLEPLLAALGTGGPAYALDLPGYGDSDKPTWQSPAIADYAEVVAAALDALGLADVDLYGTHTGASVAAELAIRRPDLVHALVLDGVGLNDWGSRPDIFERYFVSLEPSFDGAHLVRAWAMVTDATRWFPWFEQVPEAQIDLGWSVEQIHDATVELLKSGENYALGYRAAFLYPKRERLPLVGVPTLVAAASADPLQRHSEEAASLVPGGRAGTCPDTPAAAAAYYRRFFADPAAAPG